MPAVQEASAEADGKGGAVAELLRLIVARRIAARPDVQALQQEFAERAQEVYSPENLTELQELGTEITKRLSLLAPGSELRLKWSEPRIPDIPLPEALKRLVEDDHECPVEFAGHGLQRILILALLQHVPFARHAAEREEAETGTDATGDDADDAAAAQAPDLILAIEEPEIYLHPGRCRRVSRLLRELAAGQAGEGGGRNQVLYTTHSPYFVDLHVFDSARLVRKPPVEEGETRRSLVSGYSLDEAAREMARITGLPPEDFTRESFRSRNVDVITTAVNEGFFADVVVLVEGPSDAAALHAVERQLDSPWEPHDVVVVPVGGKNKLLPAAVAFRGLDLRCFVMFDADRGCGQKEEKRTAGANRSLLRLVGAPEEDFPTTTSGQDWACHEIDLEGTLKQCLGQAKFQELLEATQERVGLGRLKNPEVMAAFAELAYAEGIKLEHLETVVTAVATMASAPQADEATDAAEA